MVDVGAAIIVGVGVGVGGDSPPHAARTSNTTRAQVVNIRIFSLAIRPSLG